MIVNDYGSPYNSISARNPQTNAIVIRLHQTICNIRCTFDIQNIELEDVSPWEGIVSSTTFVEQSTVHTVA